MAGLFLHFISAALNLISTELLIIHALLPYINIELDTIFQMSNLVDFEI
jgi:hypothetical protein